MGHNTQPRQPQGQPTGGEFANKEQSLDEIAPLGDTPTDLGPITPQELWSYAQRSAKFWWYRSPMSAVNPYMDVDDIAQAASLAYLSRVTDIDNKNEARRYIDKCARAALARHIPFRAEDQAARKMLVAWHEDFMTKNKREPTGHERHLQAKTIRDSWHDQRHKPAVDFHLLDSGDFTELDMNLIGERKNPLIRSGLDGFDPDTLAGKVVASANGMDVTDTRYPANDRLNNGWDALSELPGTPPVLPGSMSRDRAANALRLVEDNGGAGVLALAWENGDIADDHPAVEALFAPFGVSKLSDRASVTAQLRSCGDNAHALWGGAVYKANVRNKTRVSEFANAQIG